MTIKQNGGVFGRNPTFNDVTIEGQLTFDGDIDINSDLKIDGDLEVTGTSKLTGNVGVGQASGANSLIVASVAGEYSAKIFNQFNGAAGNGLWVDTRYNTSTNVPFRVTSNSGTSELIQVSGTGNTTLGIGNLVIGTSGKGIDFSATAGTGTSELFSDYEEGVWTPVLSVGLTVVGTPSFTGTYTKIGNTVTAIASLVASTSVAAIGGSQMVNGLPYSVSGVTAGSMTNGNLNEGVNVAGYLDRIYALASTSAAPSLVATIVYKV